MGIQTITTPAGEEMVVMSRSEYEAILSKAADAFEDGADAATYAAALDALRPEDVLPVSVSRSLLDGRGRVAALRDWRGLSPEALAAATGLPVTMLDDIEQGRRVLDREAAAQLAEALDVPAGWLAV